MKTLLIYTLYIYRAYLTLSHTNKDTVLISTSDDYRLRNIIIYILSSTVRKASLEPLVITVITH